MACLMAVVGITPQQGILQYNLFQGSDYEYPWLSLFLELFCIILFICIDWFFKIHPSL